MKIVKMYFYFKTFEEMARPVKDLMSYCLKRENYFRFNKSILFPTANAFISASS